MLKGRKSDIVFNAFAFESTDRNDKPIVFVGLFQDEEYDSETTRSGWLRGRTFKHPQLLATEEDNVLFEDTIYNGDQFKVYLAKMPKESENKDGKPRFRMSKDIKIAGMEFEE